MEAEEESEEDGASSEDGDADMDDHSSNKDNDDDGNGPPAGGDLHPSGKSGGANDPSISEPSMSGGPDNKGSTTLPTLGPGGQALGEPSGLSDTGNQATEVSRVRSREMLFRRRTFFRRGR